jgi:hypothetical protein
MTMSHLACSTWCPRQWRAHRNDLRIQRPALPGRPRPTRAGDQAIGRFHVEDRSILPAAPGIDARRPATIHDTSENGGIMLRRIDGATIAHDPSRLTGNGWVTFAVGGRSVRVGRKIHKRDFAAAMEAQLTYPVFVTALDGRNYWHFQHRFYSDGDGLVAAEVYALLLTRRQREEQAIDRAAATVTGSSRQGLRARDRLGRHP